MARLHEFRFKWTDAWGGLYEYGLDTILELPTDRSSRLQVFVDGKAYTFKIDEALFITELEECGIKNWDRKGYDTFSCDGTHWLFSIQYDNITIKAEGHNGYPPEFLRFLEVLHKHGFPRFKYETLVSRNEIKRSTSRQISESDFLTYSDYLDWYSD